MPTIIGVIFLCLGMFCFFWKEDGLLGLLIIASVFQAASVINIGSRGIQPYYLIALFIIARAAMNLALGKQPRNMPRQTWLLFFVVIAIASSFILPVVFAGMPVYGHEVGIDEGGTIRPPLHFDLTNVAQAGFLAWHVATAYAVLVLTFSERKTRKAYVWAFYLLVAFVAAQSLFQLAGITFPDSIVRNNPGYGISDPAFISHGLRSPGSFAEPSFGGAFLAFYCIGFTADYLSGKGGISKVLLSLAASGVVESSGTLLVIGICIFALFIRYRPFRIPWYINLARLKRLSLILFLAVAPVLIGLLVSSSARQLLVENTLEKQGSSSFFNRTTSDIYALHVFSETWGLGVGLGGNRASSMLTSLLSNVGAAGVLSFGMFYFGVFTNLPEAYNWYRWGAFALLLNMIVDIPDVTFPLLWVSIMLAIQFSDDRRLSVSVLGAVSLELNHRPFPSQIS